MAAISGTPHIKTIFSFLPSMSKNLIVIRETTREVRSGERGGQGMGSLVLLSNDQETLFSETKWKTSYRNMTQSSVLHHGQKKKKKKGLIILFFDKSRTYSFPHTRQLCLLTWNATSSKKKYAMCSTLRARVLMNLTKQGKSGKVTTLNELALNVISAFISEICFILLSFKAGHTVYMSYM
jgi:hypothetical protein